MDDKIVLDGCLSLTIPINGEVSLTIPTQGEFGVITAIREPLPPYTGQTVVTPKAFEGTILNTANRTVYENIEVLEIPYTEVSNPYGGQTVSIG